MGEAGYSPESSDQGRAEDDDLRDEPANGFGPSPLIDSGGGKDIPENDASMTSIPPESENSTAFSSPSNPKPEKKMVSTPKINTAPRPVAVNNGESVEGAAKQAGRDFAGEVNVLDPIT